MVLRPDSSNSSGNDSVVMRTTSIREEVVAVDLEVLVAPVVDQVVEVATEDQIVRYSGLTHSVEMQKAIKIRKGETLCSILDNGMPLTIQCLWSAHSAIEIG